MPGWAVDVPHIPQPPTLDGRSVFRDPVRSPVPFLNAMTKATQALPGVRCISFVLLSCLYMLRSYGPNANTHWGVSPRTNLCECPIWITGLKPPSLSRPCQKEVRCLPMALTHHSANNVPPWWDLDLLG